MQESFAVQLENITKSFGDRKVLDDVSFEIRKGTAFCILGRSGTGKSVTLKQMIGLMKPDSGRILIEGMEITSMNARELTKIRMRMGFLFQNAALFDSISVGENVAFPLRRHTKDSEEAIRQKVGAKLAEVGLEKEYDKMPGDLSGGMRKRAGLARALVLKPSILLVDEPSAGLDPITSREIDGLLKELKEIEKVTVVVVTHNIPSARRLADELVVLHEGRVIARGTAEELDRSEHPVVRAFLQSKEGG